MSVRIRLSRGGSKKRPFYKVVAADQRSPRDGRFIEKLGTYNPMLPKDHAERFVINEERVKYWLGCGAEATDRVYLMLANLGLVEKKAYSVQPQKSAPKAKAVERMKEKEEKAAAAAEAAAQAKADAEAAAAAPVVEETAEVAEEASAE